MFKFNYGCWNKFRSYIDKDGLLYILEDEREKDGLKSALCELTWNIEMLSAHYLPSTPPKFLGKWQEYNLEYLKELINNLKDELIKRNNGQSNDGSISEEELIERIALDEEALRLVLREVQDLELIENTLKKNGIVFEKGKISTDKSVWIEKSKDSLADYFAEKIEETKESELPLEYRLDTSVEDDEKITSIIKKFSELDEKVKLGIISDLLESFEKDVVESHKKHMESYCVCNGHDFSEEFVDEEIKMEPFSKTGDPYNKFEGQTVSIIRTKKTCKRCGFTEVLNETKDYADPANISKHIMECTWFVDSYINKNSYTYKGRK